jgi:hypothetical protein
LRLLADEINPPEMPHATRLDRRRLGKASVYIHPHDPHPAPPLVRSRSRRDNTTTTDPRSQRNRVGRRGGQLLTRARSPSYWATCPPSVLRVPLSRLAETTTADKPPSTGAHTRHTGYQRDRAPARGVQAKTQTVLPCAETAAMLFWALLASGQIRMRKIDGWHSLATPVTDQPVALAA